MGNEEGRRVRALLSVVEKSVEKLAQEWGADRKRLIDVMYGRLPLVEDVVSLLLDKLGVSPSWLKTGRKPVFEKRSPGPEIERAVELQLHYGPQRAGGVPLFEGVGEATTDRRMKGVWRTFARRGVMPAGDVSKYGFFVAVDRDEAEVVGCQAGAYVLFLPAEFMLTPMRVEAGDELVCIIAHRGRQALRRLGIVAMRRTRRKTKKATGEPPEPGEYDIEFRGRAIYYLRSVAHGSRLGDEAEIVAVAAKTERDLVKRKGN